jgi:hypothetical protein
MRRLIAILLMLIVPLQFAWSAAESLHGHLDNDASLIGFHFHDDDHDHHHDGDLANHDVFAANGLHDGHADDGHHDGHYHPVFSMLVFESALRLGDALPDGPSARLSVSFTSHIPLLFDWPPSALI